MWCACIILKPSSLHPKSVEKLSSKKLVPRVKKAEDCWFRGIMSEKL